MEEPKHVLEARSKKRILGIPLPQHLQGLEQRRPANTDDPSGRRGDRLSSSIQTSLQELSRWRVRDPSDPFVANAQQKLGIAGRQGGEHRLKPVVLRRSGPLLFRLAFLWSLRSMPASLHLLLLLPAEAPLIGAKSR